MSVKCILQEQDDRSLKLHMADKNNPHEVTTKQIGAANENEVMKYAMPLFLPEIPVTPIAEDEYIPYSWEEINVIALSGHAEDWISVGALKSETLSEAILGTTTHDIRVIGINQDNDQSITFQTKNCLVGRAEFGSDALWSSSIARTQCQNYYNAFSGKDYIKIVSKGTCASYNDSRAGTVTYNNETVWLPSEREMGLDSYSPLSVANSTTSNAECTQGKNFSYAYYTSNTNRIKKQGDSGSAYHYWERSRYYGSGGTNIVCSVAGGGSANGDIYSRSGGLAPAFVIGNKESLPKKVIIQGNEDITDQVRDLLVKDIGAFQVGDILSTVRTDLGDNWALCNGATIDLDNYPGFPEDSSLPNWNRTYSESPDTMPYLTSSASKLKCYGGLPMFVAPYKLSESLNYVPGIHIFFEGEGWKSYPIDSSLQTYDPMFLSYNEFIDTFVVVVQPSNKSFVNVYRTSDPIIGEWELLDVGSLNLSYSYIFDFLVTSEQLIFYGKNTSNYAFVKYANFSTLTEWNSSFITTLEIATKGGYIAYDGTYFRLTFNNHSIYNSEDLQTWSAMNFSDQQQKQINKIVYQKFGSMWYACGLHNSIGAIFRFDDGRNVWIIDSYVDESHQGDVKDMDIVGNSIVCITGSYLYETGSLGDWNRIALRSSSVCVGDSDFKWFSIYGDTGNNFGYSHSNMKKLPTITSEDTEYNYIKLKE